MSEEGKMEVHMTYFQCCTRCTGVTSYHGTIVVFEISGSTAVVFVICENLSCNLA